MTGKYYCVDGANGEWTECEDEADALKCAEAAIKEYRDDCDPEWPMGVEDIAIVYGIRSDAEEWEEWEGCKLLYRSTETDKVDLEPEDAEACGYDYQCDYKMVRVPE